MKLIAQPNRSAVKRIKKSLVLKDPKFTKLIPKYARSPRSIVRKTRGVIDKKELGRLIKNKADEEILKPLEDLEYSS